MYECILISIKPRYVADILNHKKTIEVRKSMPKCGLPIDVYIYCTKDKENHVFYGYNRYGRDCLLVKDKHFGEQKTLNGKVVAKFTLNKVEEIELNRNHFVNEEYSTDELCGEELLEQSCLTYRELDNYLKCEIGYAWHISDLEIFDKPRELSEFYPYCKDEKCEYRKNHCSICYRTSLTKAPQSYMFIESEN